MAKEITEENERKNSYKGISRKIALRATNKTCMLKTDVVQ